MTRFGFDLDGGWFPPSRHLESVRVAENLGYDSVWLGDHFMPWFHTGAQAPMVWPWMGAALAVSERIRVGPAVTVPIGARYHPLLVAQASATLDSLFPGRFILGVGTGQAMSEERFFGRWPDWKERGERLGEAVALIRKAWSSKGYFDWGGKYFPAKGVYLYTRPARRIPVFVSARGPKAAAVAGEVGDHLMTTVADPHVVGSSIIPAFEDALRRRGRDPARAAKAGYFEFGVGDPKAIAEMLRRGPAAQGVVEEARGESDPRKIEGMARKVPVEEVIAHHHLVRSAEELVEPVRSLLKAGCNYVIFSDIGRTPESSMKRLAKTVIPRLPGADS